MPAPCTSSGGEESWEGILRIIPLQVQSISKASYITFSPVQRGNVSPLCKQQGEKSATSPSAGHGVFYVLFNVALSKEKLQL